MDDTYTPGIPIQQIPKSHNNRSVAFRVSKEWLEDLEFLLPKMTLSGRLKTALEEGIKVLMERYKQKEAEDCHIREISPPKQDEQKQEQKKPSNVIRRLF